MKIKTYINLDNNLKDIWIQLSQLSKYRDNPFINFDRCYAWSKSNEKSKEYFFECAVLFDKKKIVGILPVAIRRLNPFLRVVYLAGADFNDYNDIIVADGYEEAAVNIILNKYGTTSPIVLRGLREDSVLFRVLKKNRPFSLQQSTISPYYLISEEEDIRLSVKKDILYNIRRLSKQDSLFFSQIVGEKQQLDELAALQEMHRKEWKEKGESSIFEREVIVHYYSNLVKYEKDGTSIIFKLQYGTRNIAFLFGQRKKGTLYYYKPTYDPEFKKYSPGKLLIWYIKEYWKSEDGRKIDFLVGDETYKFDWCNKAENIYSAYFMRSHIATRMLTKTMIRHDISSGKIFIKKGDNANAVT